METGSDRILNIYFEEFCKVFLSKLTKQSRFLMDEKIEDKLKKFSEKTLTEGIHCTPKIFDNGISGNFQLYLTDRQTHKTRLLKIHFLKSTKEIFRIFFIYHGTDEETIRLLRELKENVDKNTEKYVFNKKR